MTFQLWLEELYTTRILICKNVYLCKKSLHKGSINPAALSCAFLYTLALSPWLTEKAMESYISQSAICEMTPPFSSIKRRKIDPEVRFILITILALDALA